MVCDYCLEWHYHGLEVLGGQLPSGCQKCGTPWAILRDREPSDEVRMYVVPKDGIYQVLCRECLPQYTIKRPDLYKGTKYGRHDLNL